MRNTVCTRFCFCFWGSWKHSMMVAVARKMGPWSALAFSPSTRSKEKAAVSSHRPSGGVERSYLWHTSEKDFLSLEPFWDYKAPSIYSVCQDYTAKFIATDILESIFLADFAIFIISVRWGVTTHKNKMAKAPRGTCGLLLSTEEEVPRAVRSF